ncbi:MAG TPA: hypothetical protein VF510_23395 [Ktedonobacterales bacterium]
MSNQDYTEDTQHGQDASGMGGASQPSRADERDYGEHDRYAQSGTLNQGYGEAEQMGEEQWAQPIGQAAQEPSDAQRGQIGASASDQFERDLEERAGGGGDTGEEFRDMVGGMYGEGEEEKRDH